MSEHARRQSAPRARPVADLQLQELTGRTEELARAWAVALIVAQPPSAIAQIPLEDLARDGPRLCAQVLRALESDAELELLTETAPDDRGREDLASAASLASLAGASDVASVVAAVEALRGVLWEALLAELRHPIFDRFDAHLLADLADRLAYVCAMVLAAALPPALARDPNIPGGEEVVVARPDSPPAAPPREPARRERPRGRGEVVIIDERPPAESSPRVVVAREARAASVEDDAANIPASWDPPPPGADPDSEREDPMRVWQSPPPVVEPQPPPDAGPAWDFSPPAAESHPAPATAPVWQSPPPAAGPQPPPGTTAVWATAPSGVERSAPLRARPVEIEIRDERVEEGPAAWIRSIGRELKRFANDGRPFAVLLIELMDVERLNRSELPEQVMGLAARIERVLESELWRTSERGAGSVTREAPGRMWLVAPGVERMRVGALAERLAQAVSSAVSHRGQPLGVVVGAAVCPDDGLQAAALAAHADVALYAARAGGSAGDGPSR